MGIKVLIADDEKEVVTFVESALTREGFSVITAFDGEQAKAKILADKPNVIILDLIMPCLGGWEVLRWMREQQQITTPAIILSAKDQMDDIKKSYALEADHYIVKPTKAKDLVSAIKTILSFSSGEETHEEQKP